MIVIFLHGQEICNARVPYEVLLRTSPLPAGQQVDLQKLSFKKGLSNRTQIKIIRLARTISDLQGCSRITDQSIWAAVKWNGGA
ncbi:hypothetical protein PH210_16895 [Paenibacillus sp. BSR1-1]|uniref:magnesium chelatase subunit ChlI family protein n=1 Tax=Paenibacillus sp. BSR1-1 TaxID=3020845 RepID=UPI0025B0BE82|nr:hypothetical protein [Paenibacillus sp. BSR1-1]MDN3017874.1 hypothetical protein [Paenibacillus sp. BSR1-1]